MANVWVDDAPLKSTPGHVNAVILTEALASWPLIGGWPSWILYLVDTWTKECDLIAFQIFGFFTY